MDDEPSGWSGSNLDFMKDSEKHPPRLNNLQTRFPHKLQWLPVPMTAELLCKTILSAILPATEPFAITAAMLD
jgi:hypothetical protein